MAIKSEKYGERRIFSKFGFFEIFKPSFWALSSRASLSEKVSRQADSTFLTFTLNSTSKAEIVFKSSDNSLKISSRSPSFSAQRFFAYSASFSVSAVFIFISEINLTKSAYSRIVCLHINNFSHCVLALLYA